MEVLRVDRVIASCFAALIGDDDHFELISKDAGGNLSVPGDAALGALEGDSGGIEPIDVIGSVDRWLHVVVFLSSCVFCLRLALRRCSLVRNDNVRMQRSHASHLPRRRRQQRR